MRKFMENYTVKLSVKCRQIISDASEPQFFFPWHPFLHVKLY